MCVCVVAARLMGSWERGRGCRNEAAKACGRGRRWRPPSTPPSLPAPLQRRYEGRWVGEYVDATVPLMAFGEYWDTCSYTGGCVVCGWKEQG